MKRYTLVITTQGLDSVLTLADDAEAVKGRVAGITEDRARVMYIFENGKDPLINKGTETDYWNREEWAHDFKNFLRSKQDEIAIESGSDPISAYGFYDMRKNVHGDFIELSVRMEPSEMEKLRHGDPYKSAIKLLSIVEKGEDGIVVGARGGMGKNVKLWKRVMKAHDED
jgi:hypothetical protein